MSASDLEAPLTRSHGSEAGGPRGTGDRVGAIWAQDRGGIIGASGRMLWRVPADFRHFKASTLGGILIMGRATWESIGRALPGRASVVLTRRSGWSAPEAMGAGSLDDALARAGDLAASLGPDPREPVHQDEPRVWIIGGGSVYREALAADAVDEVVLTTLDLDVSERAGARAVRAPDLDPGRWRLEDARSDAPGAWRPVSGDAAWRVDVLSRPSAPEPPRRA